MPHKPAEFAIIVAGGSGSRMQRQIPKQFIAIGGHPILMHTIRRFHTYNPAITLIVILPPDQLSLWKSLCFTHGFDVNHGVVAGGASRFKALLVCPFSCLIDSFKGTATTAFPFSAANVNASAIISTEANGRTPS